jgi:hypothetical protein
MEADILNSADSDGLKASLEALHSSAPLPDGIGSSIGQARLPYHRRLGGVLFRLVGGRGRLVFRAHGACGPVKMIPLVGRTAGREAGHGI